MISSFRRIVLTLQRGLGRSSGALRLGLRERSQPNQPDDQRVENDQRLPEVEMKPLERHLVPLSQVEQADDAHQVQLLDGDKADGKADQFVLQRCRKREHRGKQQQQRFDTVTAGFDGYGKPGFDIADDLASRDHTIIEQMNQPGTDPGSLSCW